MLEKKLGVNKDEKRKKRLNREIEAQGFGTGFMDFLDKIEGKI